MVARDQTAQTQPPEELRPAPAIAAPAPAVEDDDGPPSGWARVKNALLVPVRIAGALFVPDRILVKQVAAGRYAGAIVAAIAITLFWAWAVGLRLDVSAEVKAGPGGPPGASAGPGAEGPDRSLPSDREVKEEIAKRHGVQTMMMRLSALKVPLWVLINAIFLYFVGYLAGGKPALRRTATVAAYAALPFLVKDLLAGGVALASPRVTPAEVDGLVRLGDFSSRLIEPFARIFRGVDAFTLWSQLLLWLGLAEAAQISRRRAAVAVLVLFVVGLLFWNVVLG